MDRNIVNIKQIPTAAHELEVQQNIQDAVSALLQLIVDKNAGSQGIIAIDGLEVVPTAPGSLNVDVLPGTIVVNAPREPAAFGIKPMDTTPVVKYGRLAAAQRLSLPRPSTAGTSIAYIVQVSWVEEDTDNKVVRYYNSADPSKPFLGPNNSGTSQPTKRLQRAVVSVKASAASVSPATPAADVGAVAIAKVVVSNATTSIASANITSLDHVHNLRVARKLNRYQWEVPVKLTENITFYVNPVTGDDANNDGLAVARPKKNLQTLINYIITSMNVNGKSITIQLADGTYTFDGGLGLYIQGQPQGAIYQWLKIQGNMTSPQNVLFNSTDNWCAIGLVNAGQVRIQGVKVQATDSSSEAYSDGGHGIAIQQSSTALLDVIDFGTCKHMQIITHDTGRTNFITESGSPGLAFISGSAKSFMYAADNAQLNMQGNFNVNTLATIANVTLMVRNAVTYSNSFLSADNGTVIFRFVNVINPSFVTGPQVTASSFGRVVTGAQTVPGSSAGNNVTRNAGVTTSGGIWF